jgi:hypothetical protein
MLMKSFSSYFCSSPLLPPSLSPSSQTHCINNWVLANKKEPQEDGDEVIHVAWLDYRPMATIHHAKEDWREVMEVQPFSTQLRMLIGNAFIAVTKKGKVCYICQKIFVITGQFICKSIPPNSCLFW